MKILIVDDSPQIRKVIARYIRSAMPEAELHFAGTGDEALQHLQEAALMDAGFEVIFLDWHMPGKTGHDFLEAIRATEVFKEFPKVVMLSAETYPHQIASALKYNVTTYLTKPFTENEVHQALAKVQAELGGEVRRVV